MQPPSQPPGTPQDWLARAKGKLALARAPLPPEGFLEDLCFYVQQAAELAIKAVFQQNGWLFSYTHSLGKLLDDLEEHGMAIPDRAQEADQLSVYAAQTRYPGTYAPVTQEEYEEAVQIAEAVVRWAGELVS